MKTVQPIVDEDELLFESEDLLNIFKKVFGEQVVEKAFYSKYHSSLDYLEDDVKAANEFLSIVGKLYEDSSNSFSLDFETYVIVFKNGNTVTFTNSEWGSISGVSNERLI